MSSNSGKKKKKKLFFILFATILVVAAIISVVAGVANSCKNDIPFQSHTILKSACSNIRYPELCYSELQKVLGAKDKITSQKYVIQLSLNFTLTAIQDNFFTIKKIVTTYKSLTKREKTALHDCLEMIDETLNELHDTKDELEEYPSRNKSLSQYAEDLKILLSAAMTNQDSCIDGFSHEEADKKVRKMLLAGKEHVYHMVRNALAMIYDLTTDTDIFKQQSTNSGSGSGGRNLVEETNYKLDSSGFPTWLSAGDQKLLQAPSLTLNVVVAADGSGKYRTVAAAVAAAPEGSISRYIIRIKAGVYRENVDVTRKKTNIMFVGDGRRNTIITARATFNSATVIAIQARFLARDIMLQNAAGPSKDQAVAFRLGTLYILKIRL